ncbi:COQ9 family protein [Sphingomonas sp. LHG3406-1]|uniref:COQ9 family protein n=1 Tax=Sphingomonas sp. LHG3406-1 TaxID=2804617 RepID=UPI002607ED03|nr:COQ9 family protein [Sphingomonas sp. LHG3406-1]
MTGQEDSPVAAARLELALAIGENAAFDGWTAAAVEAAALSEGIDPAVAALAAPTDAAGLIDLYGEGVDAALAKRLPPEVLAAMKIRERIRALVWERLRIQEPAKEAIRRALAILAMPQNAATAARLSWRSADVMWRMAGDSATDYNHYTKRAILSAVYGSTLLAWLQDDSEGAAETDAFLGRRIEEVMRFEKWKAGLTGRERPSLTRFLGRLRYPPR